MAKLYYSVLTTYGAQAFANAIANNRALHIQKMAVGDGNGKTVTPDSTRTALAREKYKANISTISRDPRNNKQVIFELTIPENIGGFWIREMGIFDDQNRLVAYANCPESFKPELASGSGKVQVIRMILLVSSSDAVTLTVDDSVIFATRGQLTPQKITATTRNSVDQTGHTHEIDKASITQAGLVQLNNTLTSTSTTQALTAAQGKALKDELDALSVGGRNYLRNGRFENALAHWQNWGDCTRRVETAHNKKWLRLTTDNRELYRGIAQTVATFERNARYTLSFKAYSRRENAKLQLAVHQIPNNNPQVWSSPIAITDTPQTYVWSFTSADLDNKTGFHLMLGGVREQPFDIYLTDIKFEKGHRHSDWSAAPEDVMDSVQDYVRTHYVAKTGDTMTGELTLSATQPMLRMQRPSGSGFYLGFPSTTSNTAVWYAQNHGTGLFLLGNQVMANKDFYVSTHKVYHEGNVLPARQVNLRSNMAGGSVSYQDARPSELSEESVMGLSTKALLNGSGNGWMMINKSWSEASGSYAINRIGIANGRVMVQQAKNMSEWAEPFEVLTDSIFKVDALAQENLNDVMRVGLYRQSLNRHATTANNYPVNQAGTLRVEPSAYEVQQTYTTFQSNQVYVRGRGEDGWNEWRRVDGVNCLKLTGGTLTGALEIDAAENFVRGKRNGAKNWVIGTANSTSNDIVLHSYMHNTRITLLSDKVYANKDIYVGENKVNHWGDSYLKATANNYGGIMIDRPTRNDRMLIESYDNRFALIRRNTQSGQNHYVITAPERSGEIALKGEAISTVHKGHGSYAGQYTSGAPIFVEETGSRDRDTYHPIVKGKVRSAGSFGAAFSFGYTTRQGEGDGWGQGTIHLIEDNGRNSKAWLFEHSGDFYAPGDIRTGSGKRLNAVEPAGLVAYFARASAPEGWLKANGAAVSRTTYAALFAAIGTTFGEGDGRTTFNLPDLRGEFIRGFRDGRNVDNGRAFGSFQGDAIRNITGNFSVRPAGDDSQSPVLIGGNSVFRQQPSTEKWLPVNLKRAGEQNLSLMTFDASRAVPTANENRPRNIALLACIKY